MTGTGGNAEFADVTAYVTLPRLTGLALSADGGRLVATMQQPDHKGAAYHSAIWEIPLAADGRAGPPPRRLTESGKGESAPAFQPDGSLLFVSARPFRAQAADDAAGKEDAALWSLPVTGEPVRVAGLPGGVRSAIVASAAGTLVLGGSRLAWTAADGDDAARRATRSDRGVTAILHAGMPIRQWDHELGDTSPRWFVLRDGAQTDLTPDAGQALHEASASITADGATLVTSWRTRRPHGCYDVAVVAIDVASGTHTTLLDEPGVSYEHPRICPDGTRLAVLRRSDGSYEQVADGRLQVLAAGGGPGVEVNLDDLWPSEWEWSPDSATLFVTGDLHGRGAVLAVDPATGAVIRRLAADASYSSLCPTPDGRYVYALRSAVDQAPTPVRLEASAADQQAVQLRTPAPTPPLPGELVELGVPAGGGTELHGWLCLPPAGRRPAPLMVWIHGGPFSSWNSWSWRWNPWVAVAHGYAVLLPDPALSTGYGTGFLERAWPHRAALVWADVQTVLDEVLLRPGLDSSAVACLGASFGGYMTNWIAGHTDRFGAIVTHAGLWALDQQHATTDNAQWKTGLFGTSAEHPDWYAENSPNNFVDAIRTPMLIVHGNKDYRVPVSEALRLWWDLVSHFDGPPEDLPHRFLQLAGENHWVLSPANAQIWYDTVLGFCDQHVRGMRWQPSQLL